MKAIIVCVDYWDYLSLTLPRNKHHFEQIVVVTSPQDVQTQQLCDYYNVDCFITDSFYDGPSSFNKYKALEEGINILNLQPTDWLCILDADIIWPKHITFNTDRTLFNQEIESLAHIGIMNLKPGNLYTPFRRMMPDKLINFDAFECPPEHEWKINYHRHRMHKDFSGYSQIFRADDVHLGPKPWHETNWVHAGGGDTMFQNKWPERNKIRPPFEVLHLGTPSTNWYGRTTNYLNGEQPEEKEKRLNNLLSAMRTRRQNVKARLPEFKHEKY